MEKDSRTPKLDRMDKYRPWIQQFKANMASKDLSAVLHDNFCRPTHAHPSMETANPLYAAPPIPVGQAAVAHVPAAHGVLAVPAQPAGITHAAFDTLLALYFSMESRVYGIMMGSIIEFTSLYDHLMDQQEIIDMQGTHLLGSRIAALIRDYCTDNESDNMAAVTIAQILQLRLGQFKSISRLIREFNERYHVLPPRLAHTDAQKKLQLQVACGPEHKQYISITSQGKTYHQVCTLLIEQELTDEAANALAGLHSEQGLLKSKARDESASETAMASVEENTERNRATLGVRFQKRGHNSKYNNRSRSNSTDRGYHRRSPSPGFNPRQRHRDRSRSPSPFRQYDRSPGRHHRVVRYDNVNSEWRTGGSGYGESRSLPRSYAENNREDGSAVKCFSCGAAGHKSYACPRNGSSTGGVKCYACGKIGHKANECRSRQNR